MWYEVIQLQQFFICDEIMCNKVSFDWAIHKSFIFLSDLVPQQNMESKGGLEAF